MLATLDTVSTLALGLIQGLTEFLPVSSSGHIAIGERLFGMHDAPLTLSVVLHAGTLLATLVAFREDLRGVTREVVALRSDLALLRASDSGKLVAAVLLASIPTAIIGLLMKDAVEAYTHDPHVVALCLLGSALAVVLTRLGRGEAVVPTLPQAFAIGVVQGLAVLPGLTRSGSTIAAAMLLGMSGAAAFRFSFLLSLPAVGGAMLLELRHPEELTALGLPALLGGAVAFVSGYASLRLLRGVVHRGNLYLFALYLVPVALLLYVS
ncbi:MAG: undecaprenyl-diphosphate phosphatase [Polyangiales bacterium]|nr:undecaprenyl-diphosphate phosphatase [Myxococcales bacterium]MCB9657027.1 undecaprenyl-diphosphate phosphatase [Sandaracinaceae bacterium]